MISSLNFLSPIPLSMFGLIVETYDVYCLLCHKIMSNRVYYILKYINESALFILKKTEQLKVSHPGVF